MKSNMNTIDRIVRALIAITLAVLYFMGIISGTLGIVLVLAGLVLLLTSFINFCPLYSVFGISTRPKKSA